MTKLFSVRTIILAVSLLLQLSTLCFHSRGAAGDVDLSFDPGSGVNGTVSAVVLQPDGKVTIGGEFTTVKGLARSKVARLNPDGSGDSSFNAGTTIGGVAYAIALQSDGKVLVGDDLGITRLNPDGSQDTNFNASIDAICGDEGCYRSVNSIVVHPDAKVLIGGYFCTLAGTNYNSGIARLNSNGSLDSTFNPGTGANYCYSVVLQPDGKVLIGGTFIENGTNRNGVARFNANGSLDSSFNPGTGANDVIRSVASQSDGRVLIGGDFTTANGEARPHVARLYGDSVAAPSLNITRSNAFVIVSWPVTSLNFQLQESTDLSLPNSWSPVAQSAVTNAGEISVTVPATVGRKFFRLNSQ